MENIKEIKDKYGKKLLEEYNKLDTKYKMTLISHLEGSIHLEDKKKTFQPSDELIGKINEELKGNVWTVAKEIATESLQKKYKAMYNKTYVEDEKIKIDTEWYCSLINKMLKKEINSYLNMKKVCDKLYIDINSYLDEDIEDKLDKNIVPVISKMNIEQRNNYIELAQIFHYYQEKEEYSKKLTVK